MKSNSLKSHIEKGLTTGLNERDILEGIASAMAIWSTAEEWANELLQGLLDSPDEDYDGYVFSDGEIDCFVSTCSDDDTELHEIRVREPLLYTAIGVELSRAANRDN
jgi:hypothetical protein